MELIKKDLFNIEKLAEVKDDTMLTKVIERSHCHTVTYVCIYIHHSPK